MFRCQRCVSINCVSARAATRAKALAPLASEKSAFRPAGPRAPAALFNLANGAALGCHMSSSKGLRTTCARVTARGASVQHRKQGRLLADLKSHAGPSRLPNREGNWLGRRARIKWDARTTHARVHVAIAAVHAAQKLLAGNYATMGPCDGTH